MPNTFAPIIRNLSQRTSLSMARTSLFQCVALLACVFAAASYSLVYLAQELNRFEDSESAFYTRKAVQSLEKSQRLTVKDYAFWGDAYKTPARFRGHGLGLYPRKRRAHAVS
jgi:sensor domain CHASE-containing protein